MQSNHYTPNLSTKVQGSIQYSKYQYDSINTTTEVIVMCYTLMEFQTLCLSPISMRLIRHIAYQIAYIVIPLTPNSKR